MDANELVGWTWRKCVDVKCGAPINNWYRDRGTFIDRWSSRVTCNSSEQELKKKKINKIHSKLTSTTIWVPPYSTICIIPSEEFDCLLLLFFFGGCEVLCCRTASRNVIKFSARVRVRVIIGLRIARNHIVATSQEEWKGKRKGKSRKSATAQNSEYRFVFANKFYLEWLRTYIYIYGTVSRVSVYVNRVRASECVHRFASNRARAFFFFFFLFI